MTTKTDCQTLTVGAFRCLVMDDGQFPYTASLFFPSAPEKQLAAALDRHSLQPEPIPCPWTCMLVDTGRHRVLLDTGGGPMAPQVAPGTGRLFEILRLEGIAPESIDTVVLTHGHPDHIGGLTDGRGTLTFPRARHVMWRSEWAFWTAEDTLAKLEGSENHVEHLLAAFARAHLPPLQASIELLDRETEVVPGIRAMAAPGHTPGHLALAISSGGEEVLYLADTALHPIHLQQPEWRPVFDVLPDEATTTRRRLLDRAAADQSLVLLTHFPFPGLGHVATRGEGWEWLPSNPTAT
jgi:glyoxylase-like metal-dependent hydrolase (beta-lactamase superfamily II)